MSHLSHFPLVNFVEIVEREIFHKSTNPQIPQIPQRVLREMQALYYIYYKLRHVMIDL